MLEGSPEDNAEDDAPRDARDGEDGQQVVADGLLDVAGLAGEARARHGGGGGGGAAVRPGGDRRLRRAAGEREVSGGRASAASSARLRPPIRPVGSPNRALEELLQFLRRWNTQMSVISK